MTQHRDPAGRSRGKGRIPEFASREEEAVFWDGQDFTDFWDELKPVRIRAAKHLSEGITIWLGYETLEHLRTDPADD